MSQPLKISRVFQIKDRGLGITIDGDVDLPAGHKIRATIVRPDGSSISVDASKEWLLRSAAASASASEAYLLIGISMIDVPVGSQILFYG